MTLTSALLLVQVAVVWNLALVVAGVAACALLLYLMFRMGSRPASSHDGPEPVVPPPTLRTHAHPEGELHASDMARVHALRRDRRVPVVTAVTVRTPEGASATATSREISAGGMSMELPDVVKVSQPVQLDFVLPPDQPASVHAVVWWRKGDMVGVRFDYSDESRLRIKDWLRTQAAPLAQGT